MSAEWSKSLTPLWALRRLGFSSGVVAVTVVMAACAGTAAAPSTSTPASPPSTSQTGSAPPATPTIEPVHFAGLPPKGAPASTPVTGKVVLSLGYSWHMYADGRIIWQKWNHAGQALVVPHGAKTADTGFVQRRLTLQGVKLLRSRILSTGLFEHNLWLDAGGRHHRRATGAGAERRSPGVGRVVARAIPIVAASLHEGNTGPGARARACRGTARPSGGMASGHSLGRP